MIFSFYIVFSSQSEVSAMLASVLSRTFRKIIYKKIKLFRGARAHFDRMAN